MHSFRKQIAKAHKETHDIAAYLRALPEPAVAIFDIGTRAARLLVAPLTVPADWGKGTFASSSIITNIGQNVALDTGEIKKNDAALNLVIQFLRLHTRNLEAHGVKNVSVLGTAVFRWLENDKRMLQFLNDRAGIELQIVPSQLEAELTLKALPEFFKRRGRPLQMAEDDDLLLVDQGGGSLEVSWMKWRERNKAEPVIREKRIDALGTVALRREFFYRGGKQQIVRPEHNRARIAQKVDDITRRAAETVKSQIGIPRSRNGSTVHAFGVGTAITNLYGSKFTSTKIHGRKASREKIVEVLEEIKSEMDASRQQVQSVYRGMTQMAGRGGVNWRDHDEIDSKLALLYGLPVYLEVMDHCHIDELTISGYGLRYGYYLDQFLRRYVEPCDQGRYCFVSYAHINPQIVYDDMHFLHRNGVRLWYDRGIRPSDAWTETLAEKIEHSNSMVAFINPVAACSDSVYKEIHFAMEDLKRNPLAVLIGMKHEDLPRRLRFILGANQCISRDDDRDRCRALLLQALSPCVGQLSAAPLPRSEGAYA